MFQTRTTAEFGRLNSSRRLDADLPLGALVPDVYPSPLNDILPRRLQIVVCFARGKCQTRTTAEFERPALPRR